MRLVGYCGVARLGLCWIGLMVYLPSHVAHAQQQTPKEASAASEAADKDKAAQEKAVKAAKKPVAPKVESKETQDASGVKTYKFGAVEVEGRLKAPQILYFLRRVRAEFRAGLLGHRSFLPELSDTRRSPALR